MNINEEIFKRYTKGKKLEIIKNLTQKELLLTTEETLIAVLKEVGTPEKVYKKVDGKMLEKTTRNKYISLRGADIGNHWNSVITKIKLYKNKILFNLVIQLDDTDPEISESFANLFKTGTYTGKIESTDRYGNPKYNYFTYSDFDKSEIIRGLLKIYVNLKYKTTT